jgi:hypothetical protein
MESREGYDVSEECSTSNLRVMEWTKKAGKQQSNVHFYWKHISTYNMGVNGKI